MSNQSGRHAAINTIIGRTDLGYESAHHAMFDTDGIATGPFNSRLLAWLNTKLEATHTSLAGAQHAFAVSLGFADWNSLNTWEALVTYDADAAAYIDATGELFPDALNTLVLGIKAAGLWDDHIGSIKKAIGVPSLAASMIDLRNTAFNGTAVNTPTHSATAGWTLARTSSQYIAQAWRPGATDSKGTLNSSHFGLRVRASQPGGQGAVCALSYSNPNFFGFAYFENGFQQFGASDNMSGNTHNANPAGPASYILTRTASNVVKLVRNGTVVTNSTTASGGLTGTAPFLASLNAGGTPSGYTDARYSLVHGGAGLDATQAAALTTLFDAYATAAGET